MSQFDLVTVTVTPGHCCRLQREERLKSRMHQVQNRIESVDFCTHITLFYLCDNNCSE
jgi:hypothetical protein